MRIFVSSSHSYIFYLCSFGSKIWPFFYEIPPLRLIYKIQKKKKSLAITPFFMMRFKKLNVLIL